MEYRVANTDELGKVVTEVVELAKKHENYKEATIGSLFAVIEFELNKLGVTMHD